MGRKDRYVVMGNPIAHSKSPQIHAQFAEQTGEALTYERMLVPLDGFAAAMRALIDGGAKGANVTVPFKQQAHALATALTERAGAAGAVNTLSFHGKVILGDNTDGAGLTTDIVRNCGIALRGKRILLLGAGGAARGVLSPLLHHEPSELVLANRSVDKAELLAQRFAADGKVAVSEYEGLDGRFDVIVNATAASLAGEMPPLAPALFDANTLAYDMMYGAEPTVFMQFAQQHGAMVRDGLGMLIEQAAESFYLWRGVRPDTAPVFAAMRG
ncbi:MAG: aroE [Herbaspirillum sp.]|jgi:shikimate dehydrogenase|nr:aroE [Herbaspirillum sp.]